MGVEARVLGQADEVRAVGRGRVDLLVALVGRAEREPPAVGRPRRPVLVRELAPVADDRLQAAPSGLTAGMSRFPWVPESVIAVKSTRVPSGEKDALNSGALRSVSRRGGEPRALTSSTYCQMCEPVGLVPRKEQPAAVGGPARRCLSRPSWVQAE